MLGLNLNIGFVVHDVSPFCDTPDAILSLLVSFFFLVDLINLASQLALQRFELRILNFDLCDPVLNYDDFLSDVLDLRLFSSDLVFLSVDVLHNLTQGLLVNRYGLLQVLNGYVALCNLLSKRLHLGCLLFLDVFQSSLLGHQFLLIILLFLKFLRFLG